jgi:hypothetical protein
MRRQNKKGAQYKTEVIFIAWIIMLVYVLLVTAIFTSGFIKREIDVRDAEARIFANKVLYSQNGISYIDEDLGRSFPGTVDLKKINSSFLDTIAQIEDNSIIAAKVTVKDFTGRNVLGEDTYNSQWYYRFQPLAGRRGSGGASEIIEKRYVAIYNGDKYIGQGSVEIQVLIPNA